MNDKEYREILDAVKERLVLYTERELREEIELEAENRGLNEEEVAAAIEYAFEHFDVHQARDEVICDALDWAIMAACDAAEDAGGEQHPDPPALMSDLDVQGDPQTGEEYLGICGDAWDFWPEDIRDIAFKAAEGEFSRRLPWLNRRPQKRPKRPNRRR